MQNRGTVTKPSLLLFMPAKTLTGFFARFALE